ncbi:hypothetical protein [Candidatus Soleaferrea massiliensis]|uniref:hypothetical protein n=1 Tax=Candidatus Soleaferrea massiliensis TaxID=1470354 RepID=UPI00058FBEF4|nr:hypothetical protein [Candidatus Soleaferrea massiliensis]
MTGITFTIHQNKYESGRDSRQFLAAHPCLALILFFIGIPLLILAAVFLCCTLLSVTGLLGCV